MKTTNKNEGYRRTNHTTTYNVVFAAVGNTRFKIVKNSGEVMSRRDGVPGGPTQTMIFMPRKTCSRKMGSKETMWKEWMRKVSSFNAA
jgi:hypothetical protein